MRDTLFRKADMVEGLFAFVVQKHKATALHYDFRLEIGGMMPSWSIPKGPTLDPGVRRLAMPTGPHDLEYRHFEGVIGQGYGAGTVMIWDEGRFTPEVEAEEGSRRLVDELGEAEEVAREGLRAGNLKFTLYGEKLKGSFALVRTKGLGGMKEAWLLIKHRDHYCKAGYDAGDHDYSASSGRSLEEITHEA
jgi:bifunctional non-homologous end joining protein LigD